MHMLRGCVCTGRKCTIKPLNMLLLAAASIEPLCYQPVLCAFSIKGWVNFQNKHIAYIYTLNDHNQHNQPKLLFKINNESLH